MKNIIYLVLVISTIFFVSCEKETNTHKIKYQIKFLELPMYGVSNYLEVEASPSYLGEYNNSLNSYGNLIKPYIDNSQAQDSLWEYEYWELKNGDYVEFNLLAQLDYHYELRVFIDDVEVSYKRVKIHDSQYFGIEHIETLGLDNTPNDSSIDFIFYD